MISTRVMLSRIGGVCGSIFCNRRQGNSERGSLALGASNRDRSAVSLHNVLDKAQSQSVAVDLSRPDIATPIKGFEYMRQIRYRNPDSLIFNNNLHSSVMIARVGVDLDADPTRGPAILGR